MWTGNILYLLPIRYWQPFRYRTVDIKELRVSWNYAQWVCFTRASRNVFCKQPFLTCIENMHIDLLDGVILLPGAVTTKTEYKTIANCYCCMVNSSRSAVHFLCPPNRHSYWKYFSWVGNNALTLPRMHYKLLAFSKNEYLFGVSVWARGSQPASDI